MSLFEAFVGPIGGDLFSAVAAPSDPEELLAVDVQEAQGEVRQAIQVAITNAVTAKPNPGRRIALIKGGAGSGKTHVLTTAFGYAWRDGLVLPAIVQLTAPVTRDTYDAWLTDAVFRELAARQFIHPAGHSPLARLARQLLDLVGGGLETSEISESGPNGPLPKSDVELLLNALEEDAEQDAVRLALACARKIKREASARLKAAPPGAPFFAILLLAGYGNYAALRFLQCGQIDPVLTSLGLPVIATADQRVAVLRDLGLAAAAVGGALAIGLDQVEHVPKLGGDGLFSYVMTRAVRIAEVVPNAAVILTVLTEAYDPLRHSGLAASDRERIEGEEPLPVVLRESESGLLQKVVARRLSLLRRRAGLPPAEGQDSLEPLPSWAVEALNGLSVRAGLQEVNRFRIRAGRLKRFPKKEEFYEPAPNPQLDRADFEKLWADFRDGATSVRSRRLPHDKAELLSWWANEASQELGAEVDVRTTHSPARGPDGAPVVDILFIQDGTPVERRKAAICDAPNREGRLLRQIDTFINNCDSARPAILRTNDFPKGARSQPAPAIQRVRDCDGLVLGLNETEWHLISLARDFASPMATNQSFAEWHRERHWLLELLPPIRPLIEPPALSTHGAGGDAPTETPAAPSTVSGFPVYIGETANRSKVYWDPYREASPNLNNFGFLITGDAGSGKTQLIRVLIDAATAASLPIIIFDFKNDYASPNFASKLGLEIVDVGEKGLPFNPLRPPPRGASGAKPIEHVFEVAGILKRVYGLGDIQENALRQAISTIYTNAAIDLLDWVQPSSRPWPSFEDIESVLQEDQKKNAALIARLSPLFRLGLFPHDASAAPFEDVLVKRLVLKLNDLPTDQIKAALAEFIIVQLHGFALRGDQPRRLTRLMVFDEAHRIAKSPLLEKLGREGRAFGVGIVLGTQYPGDIPEATAGALATQLFLFNNQADHRRHVVRQVLGSVAGPDAQRLLQTLSELEPLHGLFNNPHYSRTIVTVVPHWKRQAE
jgi:Helicase HerA, central domain